MRTSLFIRCCDSSHCQSRGGAKGRTPLPGERGLPGDAVRLSMAKNPSPNPQILFPLLIFFRALSPPPPSVRRFLQPALHPRLPGAASVCSSCLSEAEPPPLLCHVVFVSVQHHLGSRVRSPARSRPRTPAPAHGRRAGLVCYLGGDAALGGIFRGAIMVLESAGGAAGGAARPRAVTKGE